MSRLFEELAWRETPMGVISLRRRRLLTLDLDVFEVLLGDEHLMSSLFTAGEIALSTVGLAAARGDRLEVAVGGLGLGYTAKAALDDSRVAELVVIDTMADVIDWHRQGLTPLGAGLAADPRCRLAHGDFFAFLDDPAKGLDPDRPGRSFDAILLDIDHSPTRVLSPRHAALYDEAGLAKLAAQLKPGGVFALWSDDLPEDAFMATLGAVFDEPYAEVVTFDNPLTGGTSTNSIYRGRRR